MRVVIGIDGSELAYQAVRFMDRMLSPKVDDLLLYFSPPAFHLSSKTALPKDVLDSAAWALAAAVFERATNCLSPEMREVTSTFRSEALPADGLLELAEEQSVDLVVVGSQGAARKFPFVLGSTARKVVHHTSKPVLVIRGSEARSSETLKVVIACDENRWMDASGVLREFSWPKTTEVTLFHVVEALGEDFVDSVVKTGSSNVPDSGQMVAEYRAAIEKKRETEEARLKSLQREGPPIIRSANTAVTQGAVVEELLEKVSQEKADLLVVSSRKLSAIGRLLGSTTESLLSRCPCSLLVVHDQIEQDS